MASKADSQYFPLAGVARDGWSSDTEATATCLCGAVQVVFSTEAPGLVYTFHCNCFDCRKITGSMFATNFTVDNSFIKFVRGEDNLSHWGQDKTPASGTTMTNTFCTTCGTLMWRRSALTPHHSFMRVGTVDDFKVQETKLRPQLELFTDNRTSWFHGVEGATQFPGPYKSSDA
ncbi:uncharacterized protein Triagg1_6440 [Trichoderma aggressivum f. europaeum]|uniref:CENP-V/GFA domain-containing protein n=1 Tax=Trichoderma aggressivum f. europaeum TaxID=173218 RepID=A0AAE1ICY2_9HYPO|nr:hypothetical protein Triagg1_6440 [Trichoderma aggressivum f. europaeum]